MSRTVTSAGEADVLVDMIVERRELAQAAAPAPVGHEPGEASKEADTA